ncbi:MAG: LppP/LprE family lipoprotein [Thermomicrobiales bacterium]|nr:LppP/LprE family lipoprotein [Thermomicrobiales bacterium]
MRAAAYLVLLVAVMMLALAPGAAAADGSWLDARAGQWNSPGMAVPTAPTAGDLVNAHCERYVRPATTDEDAQVVAQGWRLESAGQYGWGVVVVRGTVSFDANCRPFGHQAFVFVDGVFSGTLAPDAMAARSDGGLTAIYLFASDAVTGIYDRYAPTDPLCCPWGKTMLRFTIERTPDGPVLTPDWSSATDIRGSAADA